MRRAHLTTFSAEKKLVRYYSHTLTHTHTLTHVPYATPRLLVGDVVSSKFVENFYQYAEAMT